MHRLIFKYCPVADAACLKKYCQDEAAGRVNDMYFGAEQSKGVIIWIIACAWICQMLGRFITSGAYPILGAFQLALASAGLSLSTGQVMIIGCQ